MMNYQQRQQAQLNCIYQAFQMGFQQVSQTNLPQIFRILNHQGRAHFKDAFAMGLNLVNRFGDICIQQNVLNLWHFNYIIMIDGSDEGSRINTERMKNMLLQTNHKYPQTFFRIVFIGIDIQNDYIAKKELAELAIIPQLDIINISVDQIAQALNEINSSSMILEETDQRLQVQTDIVQKNIILVNIEISSSMRSKWAIISEALIEFIQKQNTQSLVCAMGFNENCQVLALREVPVQQQQELPLPILQNGQVQQSQHQRKILTIVIALLVALTVFGLIIIIFFKDWLIEYLKEYDIINQNFIFLFELQLVYSLRFILFIIEFLVTSKIVITTISKDDKQVFLQHFNMPLTTQTKSV